MSEKNSTNVMNLTNDKLLTHFRQDILHSNIGQDIWNKWVTWDFVWMMRDGVGHTGDTAYQAVPLHNNNWQKLFATHKNKIPCGESTQIDGLQAGKITFKDYHLICWSNVAFTNLPTTKKL